LRQRYGQALAQRNALLARRAVGHSGDDLDVWDATLAETAKALIEARAEAVGELEAPFAVAADELGLAGGGAIEYSPRADGSAAEIQAGLAQRRQADLRLGRTSWGPHLDELKIEAADRSLRRYGSQGQQRAALLALLFAEREALLMARRVAPLLLLDDVMSELDPTRRELLARRLVEGGGQALLTATEAAQLPEACPRAELAVREGRATMRPRALVAESTEPVSAPVAA
jgi:DNA replication and repair protein RecF